MCHRTDSKLNLNFKTLDSKFRFSKYYRRWLSSKKLDVNSFIFLYINSVFSVSVVLIVWAIYSKRQINKPKPVSEADMEAIFKEAKEEQVRHDQAFLEKEQEQASNSGALETDLDTNGTTAIKHKGRPKKAVNTSSPGSTVRVASGTFAEFEGSLKKLNRKSGKVCCFLLDEKLGTKEKN